MCLTNIHAGLEEMSTKISYPSSLPAGVLCHHFSIAGLYFQLFIEQKKKSGYDNGR